MKIQVWSRDGYGQGSILRTCDTAESAVAFAKKHVTDVNFDNSLTPAERCKNWEIFFPILDSSGANDSVYCGKFANLHTRFVFKDSLVSNIESFENTKIYLGDMSGKSYFVEDTKNREVNNLDHETLRGKGFIFFKILN